MAGYGYEDALETLSFIKKFIQYPPKTAIVAGSGLADIADLVEDSVTLYAKDIPNWPGSTAPGHAGRIILGRIHGRPVIFFQGRVHYYEGYTMKAVTFPTRIIGMLGVREYIATNASGSINTSYAAGEIVALKDHINLMGSNPLIGINVNEWNERFPDMTHAYDPYMLSVFSEIGLKQGVYAAMSGPSFETPAEIRMLGILGADLVGMSTVPEVIAANAMGMKVAGLSCVANMAAGIHPDHRLTAQEVLEVGSQAAVKLAEIITTLIDRLNQKQNQE
ncbi:MAG: purine-nucleoside phosphorylase [Synergistaceae bacterium]|nr:purine-nucleoside phosphorylase [Synergistaceae bacterium]